MNYKLLLVLLIVSNISNANLSDIQYGSMPELFYHDNYDNCMLLGDKSFFCNIKYVLEPINTENVSAMWNYIKNVSSVETNYRHDILRHSICVPKTCPGITTTDENDPYLRKELENCYNEKFKDIDLKGTITEVRCDTADPKYPVDWLDIVSGILFICYIIFVLYATYYEHDASYKSSEEYEKLMNSSKLKILSAFSLVRNWQRLKTIKDTPTTAKFGSIQGIRFYNTALVVMSHTILSFVIFPMANTKYAETVHQKPLTIFFGCGHLCMTTFFFLTSFFLSKELFSYLKTKKNLSFKMGLLIFTVRMIRQVPPLALVILFQATWFRHLGDGPHWERFIITEFLNCRKNGWTNLLFINTLVNEDNMCLQASWWLAVSTQYFILSLFFIWMLKKYENYFWEIIGTSAVFVICYSFCQNYYYGFSSLLVLPTEKLYDYENVFSEAQVKYQLRGCAVNLAGAIGGIAYGYYFHKYLNNGSKKIFNTKFRVFLWWVIILTTGLGTVVVPGLVILLYSNEHNAFWASIYMALARPLFSVFCGVLIIGLSERIGWIAQRICSWPPVNILGRLSYSVYLLQVPVILIRTSKIRYPVYMSDYMVISLFMEDLVLVYMSGTVLTLFVDMPISAIQNLFIVSKEEIISTENSSKNE